ncbi:MAG: hypothetical protein M1827_004788 [Pycnora praestabilis]|nr:MAG: hypothetical protein M1827_004788 [Pycnora praestabilis]
MTVAFIQRLFGDVRCPKGTKLPPGPTGKALIGNLFDIPAYHSWLKFKEWADVYGPLFRLNLAGRNHVIVSTEKIANDLLRERGNIYSSREQLPMASHLLSDDLRPVFLPYNELWRRGRRLMHHLVNSSAATDYEPTQTLESTRLVRDFLAHPSEYERWLERYTSGLLLRIGYGKTIETGEEDYVQRIIKVGKEVERIGSPGAYLVDTFPSLMYLPTWLAPFKQEVKRLHQEELLLFRQLQDDVRQEMRQEIQGTSFTRTFLDKKEEFCMTDDEGAYVIGTLFEAATGTTAAAMMSFVLAMVHHPEWQKKLQDELDEHVGDERMPAFKDMHNLPMVRAIVKEVLRWRPVTAGGIPHQLIKNDVYNDFFLPAGTNVHPNQWAIHRDPELYPDPETFNPSRWLSSSYPTYQEPLTRYPNLSNFSAFGFGRRICPGQNIAERSLNILTARIAWACTIRKKRDAQGKEIEVPWYDYTAGFNVQPKPFQFEVMPRNELRLKILGQAWKK